VGTVEYSAREATKAASGCSCQFGAAPYHPRPVITVPAPVIADMQTHAFAGYPGEAVGLLFAARGSQTASRFVPLENIQDKLHALDPAEHPRTSRNGFQVNGRAMQKHLEAAVEKGEALLALCHSHIDCGAYFSVEDQDMAAPPPEHRPNEPELWHIVMACWKDGMREANAFRWNGRGFAGHSLPGFALAYRLPSESLKA